MKKKEYICNLCIIIYKNLWFLPVANFCATLLEVCSTFAQNLKVLEEKKIGTNILQLCTPKCQTILVPNILK